MVPPGHELERVGRRYAVLWSGVCGEGFGRLSVLPDRFELSGRDCRFEVEFCDLVDSSIGRGASERLRGLPVLWLRQRNGESLRVASLEGTAVLHELAYAVGGATT